MQRTFISILTALAIGYSFSTSANDSPTQISDDNCPAISCDCSSLPNEKWISVCDQHEQRIKKECINNSNTPKDYCLVHGLNAKPLPLAIRFIDSEVSGDHSIAELDDKIERDITANRAYLNEAKASFKEKDYAKTLQILKIIDANIDKSFVSQQTIETMLVSRNPDDLDKDDLDKEVASSWKQNISAISKNAELLNEFAQFIYDKIDLSSTEKEKKIYSVLTQKTYRMAGKAFEHAGYAYGRIGKDRDAAKTWELASGISVRLAALNIAHSTDKDAGRFSEYQAAARLQRASYHWMIAEEKDEATEQIKESQKYVNRSDQKNLDSLMESIDDGEKKESDVGNNVGVR